VLDQETSKNFITYFLNQVHEAGNRFLPPKTCQTLVNDDTTGSLKKAATAATIISSNDQNNAADQQKRLFLKPLKKQSNSPKIFPDLTNSAGRNNRRSGGGNYGFGQQSSPTTCNSILPPCTNAFNVNSPKNNGYSNNNNINNNSSRNNHAKPTLFDYFTTPIKSPNNGNGKSIISPVTVSDFSSRFRDQLTVKPPQPQPNPSTDVAAANSFSSKLKSNDASKNRELVKISETTVGENTDETLGKKEEANPADEDRSKKESVNLAEYIRRKLCDFDMKKLEILSKFYTQLILSNFS
jgi:hypothetical protein